MTSQKSNFRVFESHNQKEHQEGPLNVQISRLCYELAEVWPHVYWLFPHQPLYFGICSYFMNRGRITVICLANFKSFVGHTSTDFRHIWPILHI